MEQGASTEDYMSRVTREWHWEGWTHCGTSPAGQHKAARISPSVFGLVQSRATRRPTASVG